MSKQEITTKARAAKNAMMLHILAMSETEQEIAEIQAAIAKLNAMSDADFLKYHGAR